MADEKKRPGEGGGFTGAAPGTNAPKPEPQEQPPPQTPVKPKKAGSK